MEMMLQLLVHEVTGEHAFTQIQTIYISDHRTVYI